MEMVFFSGIFAGVILIYPLWRIFTRAGLTPPLALLIFIPLVGGPLVALVLAFSDWPVASREVI